MNKQWRKCFCLLNSRNLNRNSFFCWMLIANPIQWPGKTVLLWWAGETNHWPSGWWSLWSLFSVLTDYSSKCCYDNPPSTRHHSIYTMLQIQWILMFKFLHFPSISWEWMSVQPTATNRYACTNTLMFEGKRQTFILNHRDFFVLVFFCCCCCCFSLLRLALHVQINWGRCKMRNTE